ncbi:hypothetical protein, partial [Shewanella sp. CAL98-MNA-CIBAN-0140]|uniref:hypothetical protein n=1 Tax=Shewanella sp. CAL98-MNA-CIBAN-0140 TaxID=3140462 RepID=UPI0033345BDB
ICFWRSELYEITFFAQNSNKDQQPLGGKSKDTTFICEFKDGRKFLGTASFKVFNELKKNIMASSF